MDPEYAGTDTERIPLYLAGRQLIRQARTVQYLAASSFVRIK